MSAAPKTVRAFKRRGPPLTASPAAVSYLYAPPLVGDRALAHAAPFGPWVNVGGGRSWALCPFLADGYGSFRGPPPSDEPPPCHAALGGGRGGHGLTFGCGTTA